MDRWSEVEYTVVAAAGGAVVFFMLCYIVASCRVANEVYLIARLQRLIFVLAWLLMVSYFMLLYFAVTINEPIAWPSFGVLRPAVAIVAGLFYFFPTTHPAFRWITLVATALLVVLNTAASAKLHIVITCRTNLTCTNIPEFSVVGLQVLWIRNIAALALSVAVFMVTAAVSASLGWCSSRYPPRLFDSSVPLSMLPGRDAMKMYPRKARKGRRRRAASAGSGEGAGEDEHKGDDSDPLLTARTSRSKEA